MVDTTLVRPSVSFSAVKAVSYSDTNNQNYKNRHGVLSNITSLSSTQNSRPMNVNEQPLNQITNHSVQLAHKIQIKNFNKENSANKHTTPNQRCVVKPSVIVEVNQNAVDSTSKLQNETSDDNSHCDERMDDNEIEENDNESGSNVEEDVAVNMMSCGSDYDDHFDNGYYSQSIASQSQNIPSQNIASQSRNTPSQSPSGRLPFLKSTGKTNEFRSDASSQKSGEANTPHFQLGLNEGNHCSFIHLYHYLNHICFISSFLSYSSVHFFLGCKVRSPVFPPVVAYICLIICLIDV